MLTQKPSQAEETKKAAPKKATNRSVQQKTTEQQDSSDAASIKAEFDTPRAQSRQSKKKKKL